MKKSCRKCAPKASPGPLFYFGKKPKTVIACKKFFWESDILKGDYQKPLKKITSFFLSNLVPFHGQIYKKQKGLGTSDTSLFSLRNKFTKIYLLVTHQTKFDDVI